MKNTEEKHDSYIIPPNFIEGGTLFGGVFKIRNFIEACILAAAVGFPVILLNISLTARIIILCLTTLPLGIFGLIGVSGKPLSSFVIAFFKWMKNRRVIGNVNVTIRMYEQLKKQAEILFGEMGFNLSTALNVFVRQAVSEQAIPFYITCNQP